MSKIVEMFEEKNAILEFDNERKMDKWIVEEATNDPDKFIEGFRSEKDARNFIKNLNN